MFLSRSPLRFSLILTVALVSGCNGPLGNNAPQRGQGPGHRDQTLAMSPEQELRLGRKVYAEILRKSEVVEPQTARARRVQRVGEKIVAAVANKPLQREINLHLQESHFDWTFTTIRKPEVNAFCLPGGFVAVYTGLLQVAENDDQLATVLSHEIAHALAHHASERLAQDRSMHLALRVSDGNYADLNAEDQETLKSSLSIGDHFRGLANNRMQESEADHIGVFLMTFAGYDPREAVAFWQRMAEVTRQHGGGPPEILSDHPSDARRIQQLRLWANNAHAAKEAYDAGRVDRRDR